MRSSAFVLALAVVVSSSCASATQTAPAAGPATTAPITPADLERRLFAIAHDSMMGRETGSEGAFKTTAYIASEFRRLGLQPAGDSGTYFQTVPFWRIAIDPQSRIIVGGTTLELRRDFLLVGAAVTTRTLDGVESVLAGPLNDTTRWIPSDQARGRIVVIDVPAGVSMRSAPINPGRWPGAAAIALVSLEQAAPEQIARLIEGRPVLNATLNSAATPVLWISRRAATVMLGSAPGSMTPGAIGPKLNARLGFTNDRVARSRAWCVPWAQTRRRVRRRRRNGHEFV